MDKLKPLHELEIAGGNLADRWERFLERFRWYLAAVGEDGSEDKKKVAILLTVAGAEVQEVFRTFTYEPAKAAVGDQPAVPAETAEQFNTVVRKFTELCVPRKNVIYERNVFHTRVQGEGATIDSFTMDLRLKSQSCEFGSLQDSLIRDRVVVGIRDSKIKERLLRGSELTLERAIDICKANEAAQAQMKVLTGAENSASMNMIRKQKQMNPRRKQVPVVEQATRNVQTPKQKQCKRCGTAHKFRECPARGVTCDKCGGRNHYASKCLTRRVQVVGVDNDSTDNEGGFYVSAIHSNTQQCEWIALLTVCDSLVPLKVDSESVARQCGVRKVYTVKENGILTSAQIKKEYPDIYKGLGCLEGTCKIQLRENCVPTVYPARKVPQSQKQKLKKELDRLVQTGVLVKAERPTDWVLPLVIVEKPNRNLRLCLDPMYLNEYTRREHCHLPHRSEILSEMADARYFTKMDASQGF